ncbi:M48 family metallopeptidase [Chamaesiphon polymorphus]|uniref:Peptidase M48 n=1 Tax=Chamaesiphon polymorphus CCALA 037 TaxID=2107692 RepID=A0A2T1FZW3_9CYAN|nr:M48 family metallopeptidase [Chamaesiphon polymorphus]PSB50456.1 peptidase M48 [Chamaesiphon polymorphus CCALA 037]
MATYPGISSEAFKHPLDLQAEQALRSVPGFNLVASKFVEFLYERPQLVYLMGNSIQVGPRQYATIYGMFRECVRDLDIYPEPALFISQNPQVNSYAMGQENPYIVINTGLLDLLDEDEIKTVIAHELGHIKCGHTILIQMAMWVMNAASIIGEMTFGLGNIVSNGLIVAFYEWRRKAELSSDRAALLVMENPRTVMTTMMKISGGSSKFIDECSLEEFIKQSENYRNLDEDGLNQVYKALMYVGVNGMLSHPFPVERIHYLQEWTNSIEYQDIRRGNYQRVSVETVGTEPTTTEAERLQKEIDRLQQEINRQRDRDR